MPTLVYLMQTEIASQVILANLKSASDGPEGPSAVSMNQIRMWLVPQKAEHDHDYDINCNYFEEMLRQAMCNLMAKGYVTSSVHDGVEDGDAQMFSLTQEGARYVEELAVGIEEP